MKKAMFFLFSSFLNILAFAQTKPEIALNKLEENYPTEKVFIQFNKGDYVAGENIWFKAYVFRGYVLTDISTNLYVELYDQQKNIIHKAIIPLIQGAGDGSFLLNADMPEGVYHLRAYTKWMLNFSDGTDYIHSLLIYNPDSPKKLKAKPIQWTAHAFPESGTLLPGFENRVAVRLFSKGSLPTSWKATVFENSNSPLTSFTSYNPEIGAFSFVPHENSSYYVNITDNFGNSQTIFLPKAQSTGSLIQAKQENDMIVCKLEFRNLPSTPSNYLLIGHINNQLAYKAFVKRIDTTVVARISKKQLVQGILHLTLFNEKEHPVADRLVFVDLKSLEKPLIEFDTVAISKRAGNYWRFTVDTNSITSYTAFVNDVNTPSPTESLVSALWLSNDITWPTNAPAWYFAEDNSQRQEALDALLITEKWKWFKWQDVLNNRYPDIDYQPDHYLSFTGAVFSGKKLQLNKSVNLVYQLADSSLDFQQLSTDSSGTFTIDGALFEDSVTIFYQMASKKPNADNIRIYFETNNKFSKLNGPLPDFNYSLVIRDEKDTLPFYVNNNYHALQTQMKVHNRYKQMEEVILRTKKKDAKAELNKKLSSGMFRSINEDVYDFVNDKHNVRGTRNIIQWLNGRIAGLTISYVNGQQIPMIRGQVAKLYLDEALANVQWVSTLPVTEIAMVKVQRSFMGTGGTILIYTKKGEYSSNSHPFMHLPYYTIKGYTPLSPFSFVNYADNLYTQIEMDTRQHLFWSSRMGYNSSSKATVHFYNSDICNQFKLTILGFTSDQTPVFQEYIIPAKN